jgi:SpoVK/Ycf46/Vps4 family AAA+-type ATPase
LAAAEQIKSLIKSFAESDEARFYATAMQIAASEAKKGHIVFAEELRKLIDKAKQEHSISALRIQKTIPIASPRGELSDLLEVFYPKVKLKDMILTPELTISLDRIVTEHRKFEVLQLHNLLPRRKLLLIGRPGCGKTKTAQALAGELGLAVFIVRLDGLITKFMGESISKLRLIFDAMKNTRGVYLFDEFDSIGSNRSYGNDVGEIKRVLNSFLLNIEKDDSQSIIIAATNLPEALDKALFRRFDDIIEYPLPGREELLITFKKHLEGFKLSKENMIDHLVDEAAGLSYADVIRSCQEAIKEMLINGQDSVSEKSLLSFLSARKSKDSKL